MGIPARNAFLPPPQAHVSTRRSFPLHLPQMPLALNPVPLVALNPERSSVFLLHYYYLDISVACFSFLLGRFFFLCKGSQCRKIAAVDSLARTAPSVRNRVIDFFCDVRVLLRRAYPLVWLTHRLALSFGFNRRHGYISAHFCLPPSPNYAQPPLVTPQTFVRAHGSALLQYI